MSYGVNINSFAGDLVQNETLTPTRLNPSFGAINYGDQRPLRKLPRVCRRRPWPVLARVL